MIKVNQTEMLLDPRPDDNNAIVCQRQTTV